MGGAVFTPLTRNWRWYQDDGAEPTTAYANENTEYSGSGPNTTIFRLRWNWAETGGKAANNQTLAFEYSTNQTNWSTPGASAAWNYGSGQGTHGNTVTSLKLTDTAVNGEYVTTTNGAFSFTASSNNEFDLAITPGTGISSGTQYYFRAVIASTGRNPASGESYPSIVFTIAAPSPTPSITTSVTRTPSLSISTTPSLSISSTPSLSISATPSASYVPSSQTPSLSVSATITPSITPSAPECNPTVTDDFESYNTGALAGQGNWAQGGDTGGNIQVIDASGDARVASDGSLVDSVTYRTDVTSSDQYSQLVIEVTGSGQLGVVVRSTGSGASATYLVYTVSGAAREFARIVNNSWTSVNAVATGVSAGDTIKISVIGTNVYVYLNGSLDTGLGGTGVYDISGYGITSGYPGIHTYSTANTIGDDWQGGCVITETTPSPTPSLSISATQTPSLSVSATQTPSLSISTTPSLSISATQTPSLSISATPSLSISTTQTPSVSPTRTPSLSISETPSLSISSTRTPSLSISATPSLSISSTQTPSVSPTSTPSLSISATPSLSISSTQTPSLSISVTPSLSISATRTPSLTPSLSVSSSPGVASPSPTPSLSISATRTPSITPTRTPSLSISSTPSLSISATRTPSITPTITPSISISPTRTPSLTPSPSFGAVYSHWVVKYSTTTVPNTIKSKNMVFGYHGDAEWGPTAITGFWNGADPVTGGYTIYYLTETRQEPIIYSVNSDDKCIFLAKQFGGTNINTISDAITYFSVTNPDTNIFNDSGIIT